MPEMKSSEKHRRKAAIFLNGSYPRGHRKFYRGVISSRTDEMLLIAADGALGLFAELGLTPDVVVGDFDSTPPEVLEKFPDLERETSSTEKDATDGELAIRYALDRGCDEIEIYGGIDTQFETDQMLANLFMLMLIAQSARERGKEIAARLTDHYQHIYLISDADLHLSGKPENKLSIIPLGHETRVTVKGTKWELDNAELDFGSSLPLRNEFAGEKAYIEVKGLAIVVHRHSEP